MLYLEIENELLRFLSLTDTGLQTTHYRLQPAISFERNLRQAVASMPASSSTQQAVRVIVCQQGTAMPLQEFTEDMCEDVFHACFPDRKGESVFYDMIPEAGAVWIYGLPRDHCRAVEGLFGEVFYGSTVAPMARYALQQAQGNEQLLYVWCRRGWVDVVAAEGHRLMLVNSYPCSAPSDAAYYVLSVLKQMQFDQREVRCLLTGEQAYRQPLQPLLQRYVARVEQHTDIVPKLLSYLH